MRVQANRFWLSNALLSSHYEGELNKLRMNESGGSQRNKDGHWSGDFKDWGLSMATLSRREWLSTLIYRGPMVRGVYSTQSHLRMFLPVSDFLPPPLFLKMFYRLNFFPMSPFSRIISVSYPPNFLITFSLSFIFYFLFNLYAFA